MKTIFNKIVSGSLILWAVTITNIASAQQPSAVGLMYHHFGEKSYPSTSIPLKLFEQHLQHFEQEGFQVLALASVLDALQRGEALPDKTVVITMDDAYRSVYTEAYPRLKQRGWPFTVFVSTDYIDKRYSNYMNWEQMREMQQHGASFGNHSRSHEHLIHRHPDETESEWRKRIKNDIEFAQQRLKNELNTVIDVIAYPYGEYDLALANIVESLGLIGMGQHSGAMGSNSDFRFLPRFPMAEAFAAMNVFNTKVGSLPLPLTQTPEVDPVTTETRPALKLVFDKTQPTIKQLNCFASGQGQIEAQQVNEFEYLIQARKDLPSGRSRYNCTAPTAQSGRFFWFSQPWIRPGGVETED